LTRIGSSGVAGIVAIAIVGLLLNTGLRIIEQRLLFWHYRARIGES
jgi:ABC-type nitrate/sulfonate/bicarbonate transport system permease component